MDNGGNNEEVVMLKFLSAATRIVGLTYQLTFTTILLGTLVVSVVRSARKRKSDK